MDKSEISTPKNRCRYLGLRRTIDRRSQPKTPLSDVKINYKSLQINPESSPLPLTQITANPSKDSPAASSPSTPCLLKSRIESVHSIRSLPSRLSLGGRVREKYKKKKLEFTATKTETEPDSTRSILPNPTVPTESNNPHSLQKELTDTVTTESDNPHSLQNESTDPPQLTSHEKHQQKVKELQSLISIWKEAFKESLAELSTKIEPKMDTEDLLARLDIPPEMIKYT